MTIFQPPQPDSHARTPPLFAVLLAALLMSLPIRADKPANPDEVKAAMIERITRFVQWDDSAAALDTTRPFTIAVIGETPIEGFLLTAGKGWRIHGRKLRVVRCAPGSIPDCQIVLIAPSEKTAAPDIIARLSGRKTLTIGDSPGLGELGVHVNFFLKDETYVRFEVNFLELQRSGLQMSHLLLQYAKIVNTRETSR